MGAKPNLTQNPLLKDLLDKLGNHAKDSVAFVGYLGPDVNNGEHIVFYRNIFDLSKNFEIKKSDILYVAEAPETLLPFNAVVVWLRKESDVKVQTKDGMVQIQAGRVLVIISSLQPSRPICIP